MTRGGSSYEPVIGLEIHVQLQTKTKMFCACELSFGDDPNTHTCPVCLGLPGTLPVVNAEAVHYALMVGMALNCELAQRSTFHRKNYFYPDLPKGYQVSQFDVPICGPGRLGDIRIHRAHLEEDAAKLVHAGESGRIHSAEASVVDYNRGGTPLVEIVTEPDVRSASQAAEWLRLLRVTLRQLGVSDVNMDEGSLRCDANVSIRPVGSEELGTKTELKNMNSFRFLERGVEAEIARQTAIVEEGGVVEQETLHFDPRSGSITSLRSKEESHDYRYFPEPDLVPVAPTPEMLDRARAALPELPADRARRYEEEVGLPADQAKLLAFRPELGEYYERALETGVDAKPLANWTVGDLLKRIGDEDPSETKVTPEALGGLVRLVDGGDISGTAGRQVLDELVENGGDPAAIVDAKGLQKQDSSELEEIVDRAIASDPDAAEKVRGGNMKAIGAFMGFVMRETKGTADGGEVQKLLREKLGSG